jgi:3-deoxy-7-phosphoheptulonate synthase
MPVGFKNGTDGSLIKAVNAVQSARHPHSFIGIDDQGMTSVFTTRGNDTGHLILRGGSGGPNYYEENVEKAAELMIKNKVRPAVIVDCSHANSGKDYTRQERVLHAVTGYRTGRGLSVIRGFMLESNITAGSQSIPDNPADLVYGQSVTDQCIGWEETEELLHMAYQEMG